EVGALAEEGARERDRGVRARGRRNAERRRRRERARRRVRQQPLDLLLRHERLHDRGEQEAEHERPEDLPGHPDREAQRPPELVRDVDRDDHPREAWSSGVSGALRYGCSAGTDSSWYALSALTAQRSWPTPARRLSTARRAVSIEWSELL